MRDLFSALMFSVLLVGAALIGGCSYNDGSRTYYVVDNDCGEVALEVLKGDESQNASTDAKPDLDITAIPGM